MNMTWQEYGSAIVEQEERQLTEWLDELGMTPENEADFTLARVRDGNNRKYMLYRGGYPGGVLLGVLDVVYSPQVPVERPVDPAVAN